MFRRYVKNDDERRVKVGEILALGTPPECLGSCEC